MQRLLLTPDRHDGLTLRARCHGIFLQWHVWYGVSNHPSLEGLLRVMGKPFTGNYNLFFFAC